MGFSDHALDRPLIAIVNSWNNICPGHYNLRELAEYVRVGISRAGGTALEFGTIGGCDGIAQGHIGMRYILPSRDIIANSIEIMMEAHQLDGMVLLGSCDKIVPGMPEMFWFMKILNGLGLAHKVALITDGRFSGSNNGCFVGYISPEAAEGGPIAILEDGDRITIDIPQRKLSVDLTASQIKRRTTLWKPPKPKITKGYLALYAKIASSADQGAVIKVGNER
jgi:dihydroxyacid dehydratase/phosphogluconate dehydratase